MAKKQDAKNVWWMGFTSLLTDVSSEMIFPILPIFLSVVLKANMAIIGLIEGIAELTAALFKYISGWISDKIKVRKWLAFSGYAVSTFTKPILALATSWVHVLIVRFSDRVGKGIRTSPRDALIASSVRSKERGKYFGLHRTLDTVGAIIGTLLVTYLLFRLGSGEVAMRTIFWIALIPGLLALLVMGFFVKEIVDSKKKAERKDVFLKIPWNELSGSFKWFLLIVFIFGRQ